MPVQARSAKTEPALNRPGPAAYTGETMEVLRRGKVGGGAGEANDGGEGEGGREVDGSHHEFDGDVFQFGVPPEAPPEESCLRR